MDNLVKVFENKEFGQVRIEVVNSKVYFCGKDVCSCLGYKDTVNALKSHCKLDGVVKCHLTDTLGRTQEAKFISEGNVYRLITHSKLPNAEKFETWVFDEVLPQIRQTGGYIPMDKQGKDGQPMSDSELMAKALMVAQKTLDLKNQKINELNKAIDDNKPKVLFADSVAASNNTILVGELAKLIRQNGYDIGERRLFEFLREKGYLIKRKGSDYNMPTQRSVELGIMKMKENSIAHSDGHISIRKTPKVTGKGQIYFVDLFMKKKQKKMA